MIAEWQKSKVITKKQMADIDRILLDADNLSKLFAKGGQPGDILVSGVAVQDFDRLDARISVSQTTGLGLGGTRLEVSATMKLNLLKDKELATAKQAPTITQESKTYINLGCELTNEEIAGLTEKKAELDPKTSLGLMATRIFICGKHTLVKQIGFTITASDIMLKDAQLLYQEELGSLKLESNTLTLIGNNKLTSLGKDSSSLIMAASNINLTVTTEVYGDGTLMLESIGGNYIPTVKDSK